LNKSVFIEKTLELKLVICERIGLLSQIFSDSFKGFVHSLNDSHTTLLIL